MKKLKTQKLDPKLFLTFVLLGPAILQWFAKRPKLLRLLWIITTISLALSLALACSQLGDYQARLNQAEQKTAHMQATSLAIQQKVGITATAAYAQGRKQSLLCGPTSENRTATVQNSSYALIIAPAGSQPCAVITIKDPAQQSGFGVKSFIDVAILISLGQRKLEASQLGENTVVLTGELSPDMKLVGPARDYLCTLGDGDRKKIKMNFFDYDLPPAYTCPKAR